MITSGGGFSSFYPQPSWQAADVDTTPGSGYNPRGRGYPDLSLLGVDYAVVVGGSVTSIFGTSCSAPLFAVNMTSSCKSSIGL